MVKETPDSSKPQLPGETPAQKRAREEKEKKEKQEKEKEENALKASQVEPPREEGTVGLEVEKEGSSIGDGGQELVDLMKSFPLENIKGGGSVQENRCTKVEIDKVINQVHVMYGVSKSTATTALGELIRRGGANASTPDSFSVEIRCPQENASVCVEKREIVRILQRHVDGKSIRNLAEGMAESIIKTGIYQVKSSSSVDRPGDLAKKIENRVTFKKQTPLTREERVGLASYAQWLPNLDELCGSNRVKSLLAEDLDLRKTGRLKSQQQTNPNRKPPNSKKGGAGKGKKGKA